MKKLLLLVLMALLLVGCKKEISEKTEDEIKLDLQEHQDFYSIQTVQILDLSIIKRQTNEEEKTDVVYVSVKAANEDIECQLSYVLRYSLYNEGWILDSVKPYIEEEWDVKPLKEPERSLAEEMMQQDYSNYTYVMNDINLEQGTATYLYIIYRDYRYVHQERQAIATVIFNANVGKWEPMYVETAALPISTWDIEGTWYPTGSRWYEEYFMEITKAGDTSFWINVYNKNDGMSYYREEVDIDPEEGAYFVVPVTSDGWDSLDMYITPEEVFVEGRGTRSDCVYVRY